MIRILISFCLLGQPVRYDGTSKLCEHTLLTKWREENRLVPFCPEVEAGLLIPRPAAEIVGEDGLAVLENRSKAIDQNGRDITQQFIEGARKTLQAALDAGVLLAILTDGSPSCGSTYIYDGTFSGTRQAGMGVTAALLQQNGVRVFTQTQLELAAQYLDSLIDAKHRN
jgi:uncharacterized protein YbbK (DUF523 family)